MCRACSAHNSCSCNGYYPLYANEFFFPTLTELFGEKLTRWAGRVGYLDDWCHLP